MQLEVETALNDVEVKRKEQPATTRNHYGPTGFKLLIDEAKSFAKTPQHEHLGQLEVFAHWIRLCKLTRKMWCRAFGQKWVPRARTERQRHQDANEKNKSGDGDTFAASLSDRFASSSSRSGDHGHALAFGWHNSPSGIDGRCTDEVA